MQIGTNFHAPGLFPNQMGGMGFGGPNPLMQMMQMFEATMMSMMGGGQMPTGTPGFGTGGEMPGVDQGVFPTPGNFLGSAGAAPSPNKTASRQGTVAPRSTGGSSGGSLSLGGSVGWPKGWSHAAPIYNRATGKYEAGGPVFLNGDPTQADIDAYNRYMSVKTGGRAFTAVSLEQQKSFAKERAELKSNSKQSVSLGGGSVGWPKGWSHAAPIYNRATGKYEAGGPVFLNGKPTQADVDAYNRYMTAKTGGKAFTAVSLEQQKSFAKERAELKGNSKQTVVLGGGSGAKGKSETTSKVKSKTAPKVTPKASPTKGKKV